MNELKYSHWKMPRLARLGWLSLLVFLLTYTPVRAVGTPDLTIAKTHTGAFTPLETGKTYTISVSNVGDGPTDGSTVSVVDTLPSGLSATAISGSGWTCILATLTCTRSDVLAAGNSYSDITVTVTVLVGATNPQTNQAVVSGGGEVDTSNNTALDPTTVNAKPDLLVTGYQFLNTDKSAVITEVNPDESFWVRLTVQNQGGADSGNFYPGVFLDDKPNYGPDHDEAGPPTLTLGEVTDYQGYKITPTGAVDGAGCMYYDPTNSINPLTTAVFTERGNYTIISLLPGLPANTSTTVDVEIAYPAAQYGSSIYDTDNVRTGLKAGSYQIYLYADPLCSGGDEESNETNNDYGPIDLTITDEVACNPPIGGPQVFQDVPTNYWARDYIEAMYYCGYTAGCSVSGPLLYCPETIVNRAQSSVFLLRANFGSSYVYPAPPYNTFKDDFSPGPWAQPWVQGLFNAGMTAGCSSSPMLFCPWQEASHAELAVFGLRMKLGTSFSPPVGTGTVFADVPVTAWYAGWAELAYSEGIILPCGTQGSKPLFCPDQKVSRALASYTIVKAKNLIP